MTTTDLVGFGAVALGLLFFVAGSVGLLRFPDAATRLHALTKADTLGLGLVAIGAGFLAPSWDVLVRLALIWAFVAMASATGGHLIARHALHASRREK